MANQPIPTDFFAQLFYRFFAETPKFFVIIRNVAVVLAIVSGALNAVPADMVAQYPILGTLSSSVLTVSTIVAAIIAQSTIETPSTPPVK